MKAYHNSRGNRIGVLHDDGVFRKVVVKEKHWFKKLNGWGIDKAVLDDLPKGTQIRIKDDKGVIWSTDRETFLTGITVDFDHGEQIVLYKDIFTKDGKEGSYAKDWKESMELWNSV